ncbi:hypothetical protein FQA39_LY05208 [Lamprigera yunnana]|nr:hypothetical protein FQA39_LY05208 [Lamprigera yunnana]
MALSQKHSGLMLVPWFNSQEWRHVYKLLTDGDNLEQARNILKLWKLRTPKLPSGVEGTLIILNVALIDTTVVDEENVRLLYGLGIMRFLNMCCSQGEQGTLSSQAKMYNIPEWIINLRHDVAHDAAVPSMDLLKTAIELCFDWLLKNYWEEQDAILKPCYGNPAMNMSVLKRVVVVYCQMIIETYQSKRGLLLKDVDHFILMIKRLGDIDIRAKMSVDAALDKLLQFIANKGGRIHHEVLESVILTTINDEGAFFSILQEDGYEGNELPQQYVVAWNKLLDFFLGFNLLAPFLKHLLKIVDDCLCYKLKRKVASMWFLYVMKRLLATQLIIDEEKAKKRSELHARYPELSSITPFSNCQKENSIFKAILEFQDKIENYPNAHTLSFLRCYMEVCNLNDEVINETETLIMTYMEQISKGKRVDVSQLRLAFKDGSEYIEEPMIYENVISTDEKQPISLSTSHFQRVKDTSIFHKTPIGVLQFQDQTANPWENGEFKL